MKLRIILLYGSESVEHEISCLSAVHVSRSLAEAGCDVLPVGIDHMGVWYLQREAAAQVSAHEASIITCIPGRGLYCAGKRMEADVVFPLLHGSYGEDGTVQGLLEMLPYPQASASVFASASGISKVHAKLLAASAGIPVTRHLLFRQGEHDFSLIQELGWPVYIKPNSCGSSVGITRAYNLQDAEEACMRAFRYDPYILAEEQVAGSEVQCAFIHDGEKLFISPFGEVRASEGFYSYRTKYHETHEVTTRIPAAVSTEQKQYLRDAAAKLVEVMHRPLYGRMDFFISDDDARVFFNEINTIPGMTEHSMFPKLCEAGGLDLSEALKCICLSAVRAHKERRNRKLSYGEPT